MVGAALVDDLDRPTALLSARRTEPSALAGGWELPGGKVEPGEEPLEALHREVLEELGVTIEVGAELLPPARTAVPLPDGTAAGRAASAPVGWPLGGAYVIRVWFARVRTGEPRPLEDHDVLRVLARGELYDVAWLPADLPIIEAIAARMSAAPSPA